MESRQKPITVELCSKHDSFDVRVSYQVGELTDWFALDLGTLYLEPMDLRLAKVKSSFQLGSPLDVSVKFLEEDIAFLKDMQIKISDLEKPVVFPLQKLLSEK
jgi:hypothetical protein